MFAVKPVRSKDLQKSVAETLGCGYLADAYAFLAADTDDSGTEIVSVIAMCQFVFSGNKTYIKSLSVASEREDDEAVTVLVRTVMKFSDDAEISEIIFSDLSFPEDGIRGLGFRNRNGIWYIDLATFFASPCSYNMN